MAAKKSVKRFRGVYYTESKTSKWMGRPDRVYWVNFRDSGTGKLIWERCGWASEGWTPEAAQKRRHELLEHDRAGEYKPKSARKAEQVVFGEFMEKHYLQWADQNKKRARDDRGMYKKWLEDRFSTKRLQDIAPLDLERLKREMRQSGRAEATVKHALCLVRQAYNKAVKWRKWNGDNPCKGVEFPKLNNQSVRFLTREEASQLLDGLWKQSATLAQMASFALYGGLRFGEVCALTWSNVDEEHAIMTVLDAKNSQSRAIFITKPLREVIDALTRGEPEEPLFKNRKGESIKWLNRKFQWVVDDLGLNRGITDRRERATFHTLRHTYASWAVMEGTPLYVVGKAIGHKTTVMTQRYAHLAPDSLRAAFDAVARYACQRNDGSDGGNERVAETILSKATEGD